jgi:ribonuclease HI
MPTFECHTCRRAFTVPDATLAKYPSWRPRQCRSCYAKRGGGELRGNVGPPSSERTLGARLDRVIRPVEPDLSPAQVLATYTAGPETGVFTDGAAHPNPGAGGWGAVYVIANEIREQASGHEPHTTNNRMELMALIAGYQMVPAREAAKVYTDSRLCVNTVNLWAAEWRKNGWKRKGGPIKNLDLVEELYDLAQARPDIELCWIKSHNGYRWNEYADALATAYRRN